MLIKSADDKSKKLKLLEDLKNLPLNTRQRKDLDKEIDRRWKGIQGERSAAYYIDNYLGDSEYYIVLHDLRIEVDGETAQIDHLLINRVFAFLLETKNFNADISINELGEFTTQSRWKKQGIPSPIEQSKRHERILLKLFDRIGVKMKTGRPLEVHHAVLVSPQSIIRRPDSKDFDTSCVIKADAIRQWHEQFGENRVGVGFVLNHMFDALLINNETIHEWGRRIAAEHKPEGLLEYLPNSIKPLLTNCHTCGQAISENEALLCLHNHERFSGKIYCREHQQAALQQKAPPASPESETETGHDEYCAHSGCHEKLSQAVIQYCQKHSSRFGGKLYCCEHQQSNTTDKISNTQAEQTETEQIHCNHPGCDKKLTPAVVQYCQKYSKRFHGKLYCMEHQHAKNRT